MKRDVNKNRTLAIFAVAVGVVVFVMVSAYIWNFFGCNLSGSPEDWGHFGSYIGGAMSLLAFGGVLYSLLITREQANEQQAQQEEYHREISERDSFFKMLDIHNSKVSNMEFIISDETLKGAKAFKKFVDLANYRFTFFLLCKYKSLGIGKFDHLNSGAVTAINNNDFKTYREFYPKGDVGKFDYIIDEIGDEKPILSIEDCYIIMREAADEFYDKYGHNTGHYFRNLYYTMKVTNDFTSESSKSYKNILRAQLSRYEIALSLYNALSSRSSVSQIELLENYNIFKDIYIYDLALFGFPINVEIDEEGTEIDTIVAMMLRLSKNHLSQNGRIGR